MAEEEEYLAARYETTKEAEFVGKIIGAINPDKYAVPADPNQPSDKPGFKKALKQNFWQALAKMKDYNLAPACSLQYKLNYDSSSETLEPVYFWIVDYLVENLKKPEKLVDNFTSSPGSGHFSELMGKATKMQEEAMKIMQTTGILIKSMVNIIYDLKEFEIRLSQYKIAGSKDKTEAEAGLLALKQIWMDNVDMKRGAGSINALSSGNLSFVTLRDAFMMADSVEAVKSLDLNDRVKRILEPRIQEFLKWRELSERELRKRYEIEKTYLKSQLNSLKLYTRWAKPYLRAAAQLEQKISKDAALVTAFNTIVFELALLSKKDFDVFNASANKKLPLAFRDLKLKRKYDAYLLVDLYFRGIPQRVGSNYVFGGRAEVTFRAYALNTEEYAFLKKKLEESELNDALNLVSGMTDESIKAMQEDIDYFLKEEESREKKSQDTNPFSALFGFKKKKPEEKKKEMQIGDIKPDSYIEKVIRSVAEADARQRCFDMFDTYKKSHGMASHPKIDFVDNPIDVKVAETARNWLSAFQADR